MDKNTDSESNRLDFINKKIEINDSPTVKEFIPRKSETNEPIYKSREEKPSHINIQKNFNQSNTVESSIYFEPRKESEQSNVYSARTFGKYLLKIILYILGFKGVNCSKDGLVKFDHSKRDSKISIQNSPNTLDSRRFKKKKRKNSCSQRSKNLIEKLSNDEYRYLTSDDLGLDENNTMNLESSQKNTVGVDSTSRYIDHSLAKNFKESINHFESIQGI